MIWRVRHATRYAYGSAVDLATHLLHLTPRALPTQRVLAASITADPAPARRRDGVDHFGNGCTWLALDAPHLHFEVVLDAVVAVYPPDPLAPEATPPWEAVVRDARGPLGFAAAEFAVGSPLAPAVPAAAAYAAVSFPPGRPVLAGLVDLTRRIPSGFAFRAGVTTVSTPVEEVLARREGVCQDFAHLMVAGLRGLGLPARYVSGYIRTHAAAGHRRLRGSDQSHAWVGAWLGPELGWIDLDPTNALVVGEEHVVLGWGRDFADVSPVRGVVLGGGSHSVAAAVDMEPAMAAEYAPT